ncbi:hypothetical protein V1477_012367 [Vespula maculifrons]|uniref:Uncharacterized protein n=1 Tax=Vespula maculifrons TaxID=7453 RepID=A0ABD2BX98_VESMC
MKSSNFFEEPLGEGSLGGESLMSEHASHYIYIHTYIHAYIYIYIYIHTQRTTSICLYFSRTTLRRTGFAPTESPRRQGVLALLRDSIKEDSSSSSSSSSNSSSNSSSSSSSGSRSSNSSSSSFSSFQGGQEIKREVEAFAYICNICDAI